MPSICGFNSGARSSAARIMVCHSAAFAGRGSDLPLTASRSGYSSTVTASPKPMNE
jgi:hypothetical protein